jgi:hypothetical protein
LFLRHTPFRRPVGELAAGRSVVVRVRSDAFAYPVRPCRPDFRTLGPEINPAARAKFGLLSDHAGGYPLHVRNLRTAQTEGIAHAGLLLVGGVGPAGRGPDPQRGRQYDSAPNSTPKSFSSKRKSTHDIPQITPDSNSG